jgi:hypothetical protein
MVAFTAIARLQVSGRAGERWVIDKVAEIAMAGPYFTESIPSLPLGQVAALDDEWGAGWGRTDEQLRAIVRQACIEQLNAARGSCVARARNAWNGAARDGPPSLCRSDETGACSRPGRHVQRSLDMGNRSGMTARLSGVRITCGVIWAVIAVICGAGGVGELTIGNGLAAGMCFLFAAGTAWYDIRVWTLRARRLCLIVGILYERPQARR